MPHAGFVGKQTAAGFGKAILMIKYNKCTEKEVWLETYDKTEGP